MTLYLSMHIYVRQEISSCAKICICTLDSFIGADFSCILDDAIASTRVLLPLTSAIGEAIAPHNGPASKKDCKGQEVNRKRA